MPGDINANAKDIQKARLFIAAATVLLIGAMHCGSASALDCRPSGTAPAEPSKTVILAEGDSITSGDGATDGNGSYVSRANLAANPRYAVFNHGISHAVMGSGNDGPGANSLYGRMSDDNRLVSSKAGDTLYVLTVLIGRNDLVGYGAASPYLRDLVRYAAAMKRAGWDRVYVGTLLPSAWKPFGALRRDFNLQLAAFCRTGLGTIDKIIEFDAIPGMTADDDALNPRVFADGTHPSNIGYGLMARSYEEAFQVDGR